LIFCAVSFDFWDPGNLFGGVFVGSFLKEAISRGNYRQSELLYLTVFFGRPGRTFRERVVPPRSGRDFSRGRERSERKC
jgi:hypothetical protein